MSVRLLFTDMEHHFNVEIAKEYGIEEAIVLHHFFFWIAKNAANERNFFDGLYWFYNSKKAFAELFPYMNETKIFRVIKKLEDAGFVVKGNYSADKWNRTNWYALTRDGLVYLSLKNYFSDSIQPFLFQNDVFDRVKMNDGARQNERCKFNYTYNKTYSKEKEDISSLKKNEIDLSVVSPDMMPIVTQWLAYKKEKGQTYKHTGFKTFYKKLCELSGNNPMTAMKIVEQSMANNYAGVFPLRQDNYGTNRTNNQDAAEQRRNQVAGIMSRLAAEDDRRAAAKGTDGIQSEQTDRPVF